MHYTLHFEVYIVKPNYANTDCTVVKTCESSWELLQINLRTYSIGGVYGKRHKRLTVPTSGHMTAFLLGFCGVYGQFV